MQEKHKPMNTEVMNRNAALQQKINESSTKQIHISEEFIKLSISIMQFYFVLYDKYDCVGRPIS